MIKYSCEALEPSTEGFWDRLTYIFTRDSKHALHIEETIKTLRSLKTEQVEKFLKMNVDYLCMKADYMLAAIPYVTTVYKFMIDNFEDIKKAGSNSTGSAELYTKLSTKLDKLNLQDKKWDVFNAICSDEDEAVSKRYLQKDRSFRDLGYSISRIITIAYGFKNDASGNLSKLKSMKWSLAFRAMDEQRTGAIGSFSMFYAYTKVAMELYRNIDYFLHYVDKRVQKI
jgi:hypothetical protein